MIVDKKKISNFLVKEKLSDPWDIIDLFEKKVSKFSGSKYAVAVDCCTNAIFLCLKFIIPLIRLLESNIFNLLSIKLLKFLKLPI